MPIGAPVGTGGSSVSVTRPVPVVTGTGGKGTTGGGTTPVEAGGSSVNRTRPAPVSVVAVNASNGRIAPTDVDTVVVAVPVPVVGANSVDDVGAPGAGRRLHSPVYALCC